MAKYKRMINCDFVNAGSFKLKTSNRAKLLYFFMLCNADDKGFVDNADELIELLDSNDRKFGNESNATLMPENFETALSELLDKGLLYKFEDRHNNKIYLIRQWYIHNQIPTVRVRDSSYEKYLEQVKINDEKEYEFCSSAKQVSSKCHTTAKQLPSNCQADDKQLLTQNKINKSKVNKSNINIINKGVGEEPNSQPDDDEEF